MKKLRVFNFQRIVPSAFVILFTVLMTGCSSGYLRESLNVSNTKKNYSKILVIGKTESELARVTYETKMVENLKERGVNAVASNTLNLASIESIKDVKESEALKSKLLQMGFDGVVVTHMVGSEQYVRESNNAAFAYGHPMYYRRFRSYYVHYDPLMWNGSTVESGTRYFLESGLYALNNSDTDNLQWVGQFRITDPRNISDTVDKYTLELTELLMENSIQVD